MRPRPTEYDRDVTDARRVIDATEPIDPAEWRRTRARIDQAARDYAARELWYGGEVRLWTAAHGLHVIRPRELARGEIGPDRSRHDHVTALAEWDALTGSARGRGD